ncbi:hypothetical protein DL766_001633 [Monosporascus sp. MC13-8B]|uniref:Deoxyribonuclease NucA/NucB domain-containing protein n=1 Tax=Monosporascus cannonballus TaxID=155416 RepID=A0ABY0GV56_9PEZI|nr:hypothetical protein DL762_008807 [Monosporascus cannonballus]RYO81124.1 hypothetical protein DL763_008669 [Monosporascus cannonballus]RYP37164.1 hypothetical protein DL766_001633 [Monosporascus sp. MC13-8B]
MYRVKRLPVWRWKWHAILPFALIPQFFSTPLIIAYKALLFIALTWITAAPHVAAAPSDNTFDCNRIPEICTNICWATRCASPKFSLALTNDNPSPAVATSRRNSAGCGSNSKCTKNGKGVGKCPGHNSCDEHPFATTSQSKYPNGHQVSRCVPNNQNSSQGASLRALYQRLKRRPGTKHKFVIGIGNPGAGGIKYCKNQACKNDGWQVQDRKISRRDEDPSFKFFGTGSGMVLASMENIGPMPNFTREVDVQVASLSSFDTWTEDIDGDSLTFMSDIVLEEMSQAEAMEHFGPEEDYEDEGDHEKVGGYEAEE